jgi:putative hemolysin
MESYLGLRLLLLTLIVLVNGFFAAAEVSLVSVRRSRLKALADQGKAGAQAALSLLENPERLLSVTQVGVTLASLGLGWAGEPAIFALLVSIFGPWTPPEYVRLLHAVGFVIAFLLISYAHVVIGEVVPKNLAIDKADRIAVLMAPPLLLFYRISAPFVYIIERSAAAVSRAIGVRGETTGGHSAEEIKFIVSMSGEDHLRPFERDAIRRLLELPDYIVREIMVPRIQIVSMPVDSTLDDLLRAVNDSHHSRIPIFEERPESIIGYVHFKDLLRIWEERRVSNERRRPVRPFQLRRLLRKLPVAPETKPVNQLIDEFRQERTHMALVVDEFGAVVGLVTLEDVIEQVFGEIEDEYDVRRPEPQIEAAVLELDGTIPIRDLEMHYGIELPAEAGFETLAGFLLLKLGYIPRGGETVEHGDRRFTIEKMEGNRIATVKVERIEPEAETI